MNGLSTREQANVLAKSGGDIQAAFNAVESEIAILEECLSRLDQKLDPILMRAPRNSTTEKPSGSTMPQVSKMAEALLSISCRVRNARQAIAQYVDHEIQL